MKGKAWEDHDLVEEHGKDKDKREVEHKMVEGGESSKGQQEGGRNTQICQNVRKI